ncbi:MAG TPA: choice-of-anchor tandem repeat GloVer-containing protein, partial [Candidatus Methylacidiphilales bacterium]
STDKAYQQIVSDVTTHPEYAIHQMSMSYALGESVISASQLNTDAQYFASMAAAGVTVFASSGDYGATAKDPNTGYDVSPEFPAADPSVTGVGGTSLTVDSNGNPSSEVVWNNSTGASGGAPAVKTFRPSWQTGPGVQSGNTRLVPDVACVADPNTGAVVILNGSRTIYGGTSWSSPTWAAFCALINQNRAKANLPPIGLLNPYLYPLIGTANFRDIVSGNNSFSGMGYSAGPGYDMTTGVGVPNVQMLAQTLTIYNPPLAFSNGPPPASCTVNTPYSFACKASGNPSPNFSLASGTLPPGLSLTPAGLLSGTPTQTGTYSGTIMAGNGGASSVTQNFSITISAGRIQQYTILHSFKDGSTPSDGFVPNGTLVQDSDGNFYGTTQFDPGNYGVLYRITPQGAESVVHHFGDGTISYDGKYPLSGAIKAADGNLYGSTSNGGNTLNGAVYKMTPQGIVSTMYSVTAGHLGTQLASPVVQGTDGNFYGTAQFGSSVGDGALFKLTPQGVATLLHSFGDGSVAYDGAYPVNAMIQGPDGNFYGTTPSGGSAGLGTLYRVTPQGVMTILHHFGDGSVTNDGASPQSALLAGSDGNLYGTTDAGGSAQKGTLFTFSPQQGVTILHSFGDGSVANDGTAPQAALIQLSDGNYYGTTSAGGSAGYGTIFSITPQGSVTILHSFADGSVASDGNDATTALTLGTDGFLYGTTTNGGTALNGIVFKFSLIAPLPATSPLIVNSPQQSTAAVNSPYTFVYSASGYPAPTFSVASGSLPPGLALSAGGALTGTPTQPGVYTGTISANNGVSPAATQNFSITVQTVGPAPVITNGPLQATVNINTAYSFTYTTTGTPAPTFTLSSGSLPSGLTLSTIGTISGSATQYGTFTGAVTARNGVSPAAIQNFTITVDKAPTFAGGPTGNAALGNPVNPGSAFLATGYPAPTFSVTAGGFPPGVTLSASGLLSGTPTQMGTYVATISASNGVSPNATLTFALNVYISPSFTSGPPPSGTVNSPYNFTWTVASYPAASVRVTSGALPPGLSLSASGVLSGTPTQAGTYTGYIAATNSITLATQSFSITIMPPPSPPSITDGPPPAALLNAPYSFAYTFAGNPAPTFAVSSGALPSGLTLSSSGVISGTPITTGTYTGAVTATNALGSSPPQSFSIIVRQPLSITNGPPPATGTVGAPYSFTYLSTGNPAPTFSLTAGSLPPGLSLSPAGVHAGTPSVSGTFAGTVSAGNGTDPPVSPNIAIAITDAAVATDTPTMPS